MKSLQAILCVAIVLGYCCKPASTSRDDNPQVTVVKDTNAPERRTTSESVGAIQLINPESFPAKYRAAAISVFEELTKDGETPNEFYAHIEAESGVLIFHLWHQDAFKDENLALTGNPGGKCRDFHYDAKQQRVTKKLLWQ